MVKEVFIASGMSVSELGRRVQTTRQNIYRIFERQSIDTDLLQRLGKALNHDFFSYYATPPHAEKAGYEGKGQKVLYKEVETLQRELADVTEKYEMLKRINELLEKEAEN
ncbi:MAG: hypothetical protein L0956_07885 [Candidatus Mariimomonas ferrooxydans]